MEEYLETLLAQVRCHRARPFIGEEIRNHIVEQTEAYQAQGMESEKAQAQAVRDMGDPVETGIALDRIHRPRIAWGFLLVAALVGILGVIFQMELGRQAGGICEGLLAAFQAAGSGRHLSHILLGIGVMCVMYIADYTMIARCAKPLGLLWLGMLLLYGLQPLTAYEVPVYVRIGSLRAVCSALLLCYVPIYGALLYQYRGKGRTGLGKAVLWLLLPVLLALRFSLVLPAMILYLSMLAELALAVQSGWFGRCRRRAQAGIWLAGIALPAFGGSVLYFGDFLKSYQSRRIDSWLLALRGRTVAQEDYCTEKIRFFFSSDKLFGRSETTPVGVLPDCGSDFFLTYFASHYGLVLAVALCLLLAGLIALVFGCALRQKNQLGRVMGCGCGMVFLLHTAVNILINTGCFPRAQTFLPFFSSGGSMIVVSYALLGVVMSIYRYQDVYPAYVPIKLPKWRITIEW